ncbi:alpha/beta hydrolase [Phanerochaete sordida]|uniref:Alpha/beta hydrolase n=1 Tax=Phanerochaete sordida TaxID=48140 RepID=A0A9P3GKJ2_9APHY|nr:alpha/beta hydrolase [Phanerochaete sordida]
MAFNWLNLAASTNLSWTSCYEGFQCARLSVPLLYSNHSAGEAQLALVKLPSKYSSGHANYRGPLLFNPGGPGNSGVQFVVDGAAYFRDILGPEYDLVGFDPRGVGATTPFLSVFKDPAEALQFYSTYPLVSEATETAFGQEFAQSQILGRLAFERAKEVAESVTSLTAANDMMSIIKAFGVDKLNYWGVSYGSVIGATFAAKYPDNVGRLVIDGVVNSHQWYGGRDEVGALVDADKALESIYEACVSSGPSACALHESSTALIAARVQKLIDKVRRAPVQVLTGNGTSLAFGVVDYNVLLTQLYATTFFPYRLAPAVFAALAQLERGDGSALFSGSTTQGIDSLSTCSYNSSEPYVAGVLDISLAVLCGDNTSPDVPTLEESYSWYQEATKQSPQFTGSYYGTHRGACAGWTIRGKDKLDASFATNTSYPLLIISNTLDPVTPITSARNMSAGFAGSVLLQQNSTGHMSMSGFSTCTAQAIRAYFADGILPAHATVCQPDGAIFEPLRGPTSPFPRAAQAEFHVGEGDLEGAVRALAMSGIFEKAGPVGIWRKMGMGWAAK